MISTCFSTCFSTSGPLTWLSLGFSHLDLTSRCRICLVFLVPSKHAGAKDSLCHLIFPAPSFNALGFESTARGFLIEARFFVARVSFQAWRFLGPLSQLCFSCSSPDFHRGSRFSSQFFIFCSSQEFPARSSLLHDFLRPASATAGS
jgi:hypothetical protein